MSAMDDEKGPQEETPENVAKGELLYCGGTSWDSMGRKTSAPAGMNLVSPTRLRPLIGVDIRFVASGCTSCHCVALDVEGRCYTWGRNEKGQLGHGDTRQRSLPTIVSQLSKYQIVTAGAGRNHTVVVTDDGKSYSFGWNKHGQLGSGSLRNEIEPSPVLCQVPQVTNAVCGADFTVWLSSVEGSSILTAGLPQYGQLGHGTDNEYNVKDGSVKLAYEAQPRPRAIAAFFEKIVVKVACGTNHTVAVDSSGFVYTWGFGGYGRLGHREQKDEWVPRLVEVFQKRNVLPPNAVVSAGSVNSACTAGGGQLYMWGKLKTTGDDWMYPKPVMDLSGWNIRCMDSGNMHHVIGADDACISWGHAQYGELGYGPLGPKSSANPKKVEILDHMHVMSVACGLGLSVIVVDRAKASDRLEQLEIYECDAAVQGDEGQDEVVATEKKTSRKAAGNSSTNSKKRKNKDSSSESEEVEDEYEDSEEESNEDSDDENGDLNTASRKGGGKSSGRGRGRGAKKTATETKNTGKGRGRPKKTDKSLAQHEAANTSSGRRGRGRPRKSNR
ncbi:protein RCC2 [Dioscorea cayenensis subsp. rotundata]|uniref:Protein RCC2 n=1 Tax=Dioscorea cayennensis subsp. rotundata TaxID=55577 RepID=A0AB40BBZ6_DIOCR|nr:protein RCC2 [Dioscorea cayenensis subsp. rotundata]